VALGSFVKGFDQIAPGRALAVIDLAKVQHMPLHHPTTETPALRNTPIAVFLPVLEAPVASQIHAG
jgi:hypothetical protein